MTDERFLQLCYFGTALFGLLLGSCAHRLLRESFRDIAVHATGAPASRFWTRLFQVGIVVSGFSGFLSVSVPGCSHRPYKEVVSNRRYILGITKQEASSSMFYLVDGLLVSAAIVGGLLLRTPSRGREGLSSFEITRDGGPSSGPSAPLAARERSTQRDTPTS